MYPGIHAQHQPDKVAIIHPASGTRVTYRELDAQSNRLAQLLHAQGLRPGDHLALFLENHPLFLAIAWACLRSGLYFTPINRHLSATEAAYIVDDCDARVLIASAALEQTIELGRLTPRCELKLAVGGGVEGFTDYAGAVDPQPATPIAEEAMGTLMLYSSGTTGKPKGVKRPRPNGLPAQGNPA